MTYQELVDGVKKAYEKADASAIKEHIALQFNVWGDAEGAFYLEIADGKIYVEPFEYFDCDAKIIAPSDIIMKIATGESTIYEENIEGNVFIQGNAGKALMLKDVVVKKKAGRPKKAEAVEATKETKKAVKTPAKKAPAKKATTKKVEAETKATEVKAVETKAETPVKDEKKAPAKKTAAKKAPAKKAEAKVEAKVEKKEAKAEVKEVKETKVETAKATTAKKAEKAPAKKTAAKKTTKKTTK